ncbi:MAG: S8 family serine peptidase [Actinobacteria bacterium]|nr:S8 family serine peptidase [Actinomycetota bacterium]
MLVSLFFTASVLATLAPAGASSAGNDGGGHEYHEDLVLVAFDPGTPAPARASAHASERGEVENTMEWLNLDVVRLPEGVDPAASAVRYERNPNVAYAHPNWEVSLLSNPNDTLYIDEWGLNNTGQSVTGSLVKGVADKDIDAPEGWDVAFGSGSFPSSGGTRVGILDTGIDLSHVDLFNKTKACANALTGTGIIINGSCSDDNLHGTHVAGTVGAITNNSVGVAGVAPNSEFAIFKGLDAAGVGFYADIIAGIHWLHTTGGARIVSMSLGGPQDDALDKELTEAAASGALLIAAAGNDGDSTPNYPAYHADVMSVAAIDAAGERPWFSNCNADVEIAAPGVDVWSTTPGNSYALLDGTSMSTPHVSGVAAMLMWAKGTDASQTRSTMKSTGEGDGGCNNIKVVNLAGALGGSVSEPEPTDPGAIAGKVTDGRTKAAISGATVDCGTAGSATTDSAGNYSITNVTPSTYTCTASATGYRSKSQNVTVNSGQTTTANFALRPQR